MLKAAKAKLQLEDDPGEMAVAKARQLLEVVEEKAVFAVFLRIFCGIWIIFVEMDCFFFFLMGFSNMIFFTKLMGFPPKNDGRWEFS